MFWKTVATTIVLGASTATLASAAGRTGVKGKSYDVARTKLMREGFRPVHFQRGPLFDPCPDDPTSCRRYPEALYCSGTGLAYCQFAFFDPRHRRYIVVTTRGEEGRAVDRV